jgi:N-acetylglucosaminyldiphosphoundecaprenol N-acetyl-beta-D-mannosaminyltransferase
MNQKAQKIDFLGIPLDAITMNETLARIDAAIAGRQKINHVVINAGKVVAMQHDRELFNSVVTCDLINADGQSIVWAARFLGLHIPERVAGVDLMDNLIELAAGKGYSCFFFGAKQEVVTRVVEIYQSRFGEEVIAGYRNGYFNRDEEKPIAQMIAESGADILFVAMPSPHKENFMYRNREVLKDLSFNMGVGGSFDVVAGHTKRAPVWMQKIGMEWFFRFIQEPKRMWKRYLVGNSKFIILILKERFKGRR